LEIVNEILNIIIARLKERAPGLSEDEFHYTLGLALVEAVRATDQIHPRTKKAIIQTLVPELTPEQLAEAAAEMQPNACVIEFGDYEPGEQDDQMVTVR
jgi:hypothetical protein